MSSKTRRIAKPSDYVVPLSDLPLSTPLISFSRASTPGQKRNLLHQKWDNFERLEDLGFTVLRGIGEISSGSIFDPAKRPKLVRAVELAKKFQATIVFADTDRLIRSSRYSKDNNALATNGEFDALMKIFDGVPVATIQHPDIPRKGRNGIRSNESKRGQAHRGNSGGRPRKTRPGDKKRKKEKYIEPVRQLRVQNATYREIEKQLEVPRETARRWMEEGQRQ